MSSYEFWAVNFGLVYDRYSIYPHNYIIYEPPLRGFVVRDMGEIYLAQTDFMLDLDVISKDVFLVSDIPIRRFVFKNIILSSTPPPIPEINLALDGVFAANNVLTEQIINYETNLMLTSTIATLNTTLTQEIKVDLLLNGIITDISQSSGNEINQEMTSVVAALYSSTKTEIKTSKELGAVVASVASVSAIVTSINLNLHGQIAIETLQTTVT